MKTHLNIIPNHRIFIPTYDGADLHASGYLLNSFVELGGEDLHTGHYTAVLKDPQGFWRADDNAEMTLMSEQHLSSSYSRSYLFFYIRERS